MIPQKLSGSTKDDAKKAKTHGRRLTLRFSGGTAVASPAPRLRIARDFAYGSTARRDTSGSHATPENSKSGR